MTQEDLKSYPDTQSFANRFISYIDVSLEDSMIKICTLILSGPQVMLVEGYEKAIVINNRSYPSRSISEPDSDRVLRGARDSFCETIVLNTALVRRHIRDRRLVMEQHSLGTVSKTIS